MTEAMSSTALYGYASQFSVAAGDAITFHVSGENLDSYHAQLVRLRHGLERPDGPGFRESEIDSAIEGDYAAVQQPDGSGSYVDIDDSQGLLSGRSALSLSTTIYATLVDGGTQGLIGSWDTEHSVGYALVLRGDRLTLCVGDGRASTEITLDEPLEPHAWYSVSAGFDLESQLGWIEQKPMFARGDRVLAAANRAVPGRAEGALQHTSIPSGAPFRIAALSRRRGEEWAAEAHFNGKLGNPTAYAATSGGTTLAAWDFSRSDRADKCLLRHVVDTSENHLHGTCVNAPTRGVTGAEWDGIAQDYRLDPDSYRAIHFHEDDLDDARWPVAFEFVVPADMRSGVYAVRLRANSVEEHIPFIVRPAAHQKRARVVLLLPTGSYLAYANDRLPFDAAGAELLAGHVPVLHRDDLQLQQHYDFGRSCYEVHPDESGVIFSSRRRPIINMRPRYFGWFMPEGPWQFPADLCIVDWLDEFGIDYDVICDEDLHREGYDLLAPYQVVLTGSHPEYVSRRELEAVERYLGEGGRLMYLGGNGFYWLVSYDPEKPYLMEIRRSENGSRPHQSWPGEHHHQTTGEMCGMWRSKGRAPQRLLGVGFGSEGFDRSSGYHRMPDSCDAAASFIFEGIDESPFGEFGLMGGGAAGAELDRYDVGLGSPPQALLVASSVGMHSDDYQEVSEDLLETPPTTGGTQSVAVRSDVVYTPLEGGGAVFSVGSIAWTGALSHNGYDNSIARLTGNVLHRFLSEEALPSRS